MRTLHFFGVTQKAYRHIREGDSMDDERDVDSWWNGDTHQTRNETPLICSDFNIADFSNQYGELPPILTSMSPIVVVSLEQIRGLDSRLLFGVEHASIIAPFLR